MFFLERLLNVILKQRAYYDPLVVDSHAFVNKIKTFRSGKTKILYSFDKMKNVDVQCILPYNTWPLTGSISFKIVPVIL